MRIIEKNQGCPTISEGCFGPYGEFYTVFGTELRFLGWHIFISIIFGLILSGILLYLRKNEKIKLPFYLIFFIQIVTTILFFFLLAYLFPISVIY